MSKVRRIDWSPDEYIGGTFGRLTVAEHGMYCVVLNMIYSNGAPIEIDWPRFARACCSRPHTMQRLVDQLISKRKLRLNSDGRLSNGRADRELGKAADRIEDARRGGIASGASRRSSAAHQPLTSRSPADEPDDTRKRSRHFNRVSRTPVRNHQPSTIISSLSESLTDAAREPAPDQTAPARAHAKPDPTPGRPAKPADPRLVALAAKARAKLMKGE